MQDQVGKAARLKDNSDLDISVFEDIIAEADFDHSGAISYADFCTMMNKLRHNRNDAGAEAENLMPMMRPDLEPLEF